jgi:hypothetical protein
LENPNELHIGVPRDSKTGREVPLSPLCATKSIRYRPLQLFSKQFQKPNSRPLCRRLHHHLRCLLTRHRDYGWGYRRHDFRLLVKVVYSPRRIPIQTGSKVCGGRGRDEGDIAMLVITNAPGMQHPGKDFSEHLFHQLRWIAGCRRMFGSGPGGDCGTR